MVLMILMILIILMVLKKIGPPQRYKYLLINTSAMAVQKIIKSGPKNGPIIVEDSFEEKRW